MSVNIPALPEGFRWTELKPDSDSLAAQYDRIILAFPRTWAAGDPIDTKLLPAQQRESGFYQVLAIRPATPVATPAVSSGKIVLEVHMDDTIQLRAKTEKAQATEHRCGTWWKIIKATTDRWFLRSISRKEQGLAKLHNVYNENLWIDKQNDPDFEIIRVCPFPKDFNYKEYQ